MRARAFHEHLRHHPELVTRETLNKLDYLKNSLRKQPRAVVTSKIREIGALLKLPEGFCSIWEYWLVIGDFRNALGRAVYIQEKGFRPGQTVVGRIVESDEEPIPVLVQIKRIAPNFQLVVERTDNQQRYLRGPYSFSPT